MQRIIILAIVYLLAVTASAAEIHGSWTAKQYEGDPGEIHLNMAYGDHNNIGRSFDLASIAGLTPSQIAATTETKVEFELRRDAGVIALHGYFERGEGAGHFTFTPNRDFLRTLESIGVRSRDAEKLQTDEKLFSLTAMDVSVAFIRAMRAEGYDLSVEEYMTMRIFGVSPEILAAYRRLGYDKIPFDRLIAMRVHRVTPDYIQQMRAAGYPRASLDDLVTSRIHGATPQFIEGLRAAGYTDLPFSQLIQFRIHGVSVEMIRELRALGYDHLTADQLVRMRIHGVTPDYIRSLKTAGYSGIPAAKLIEMRIRGIDAAYVQKMQ